MDSNTPSRSKYRNPDETNELRLASNSVGEGGPVLLIHGITEFAENDIFPILGNFFIFSELSV